MKADYFNLTAQVLIKKPQNLITLDYHQLFFSNTKCLSTVECVGHALALLEENQDILEKLTKPLLALCSIQISHGAVKHDSFEYKKDINNFKKENCRLNVKIWKGDKPTNV